MLIRLISTLFNTRVVFSDTECRYFNKFFIFLGFSNKMHKKNFYYFN